MATVFRDLVSGHALKRTTTLVLCLDLQLDLHGNGRIVGHCRVVRMPAMALAARV